MPVTCLVFGCNSRGYRNNVKFYSVPNVLNHKWLVYKNKLSQRRRALWIAAIRRSDIESKLEHQKICSKHFVTGKPAELEDVNHPDWVPSLEMGHTSDSSPKRNILQNIKVIK